MTNKDNNKETNKNIINIKIGEDTIKRKRRKYKKKVYSKSSPSYNITNITPQANTHPQLPVNPIHPSFFHHNRPQYTDLTSQIQKDTAIKKENDFYKKLFDDTPLFYLMMMF